VKIQKPSNGEVSSSPASAPTFQPFLLSNSGGATEEQKGAIAPLTFFLY